MNILKKIFLFIIKTENSKEEKQRIYGQDKEIAKLVKEGRIKLNLTVKELSKISKIPEQTIIYIENNDKKNRPKFPFLRSILIKLEECLLLKKNTLVKRAIKERKITKKEKRDFIISKFDLINTWQGTLLYFFILILTIFILKRYFVLDVNVIEIQNIENNIIENKK